MNIFSHILATFLLGKALKIQTEKQWLLALLFGVGIDWLDFPHMFKSIRGFLIRGPMFGQTGQYYYRSFIQEPISLLWVIPIAFYLKTPIPVIFFTLHVGMDFICKFEKRPFWPFSDLSIQWGLISSGTKVEIVLGSLFLLVLAYGQIRRENSGFRTFISRGKEKIKAIRA